MGLEVSGGAVEGGHDRQRETDSRRALAFQRRAYGRVERGKGGRWDDTTEVPDDRGEVRLPPSHTAVQ